MNVLLLFWGGGEGGDAAACIELAAALKQYGKPASLAAYCTTSPHAFRARATMAGLVEGEDFYLVADVNRVWEQMPGNCNRKLPPPRSGAREAEFDIVHVHHGRSVPKRTDILPLRRLAGRIPLFITAHGPLPLADISYGGWKSHISRYISPLWFKAIVVPSEAKRKEWVAFTPFSRKVVAIPNIVRFFERQDDGEARRLLGIQKDQKVVLFCSRLDEEKDPLTFIRAIAGVPERANVIGIMAGSGALEHECKTLIEDLGAPVKLVGYRTDLDAIYSAADAFVQPSLYESFCITLLQAVEMGIPAAASKLPVLQDFYRGIESVEWFDVRDVKGCRSAIEASLAKGGKPRPEFRKQFSPEAIVEAHLRLWGCE